MSNKLRTPGKKRRKLNDREYINVKESDNRRKKKKKHLERYPVELSASPQTTNSSISSSSSSRHRKKKRKQIKLKSRDGMLYNDTESKYAEPNELTSKEKTEKSKVSVRPHQLKTKAYRTIIPNLSCDWKRYQAIKSGASKAKSGNGYFKLLHYKGEEDGLIKIYNIINDTNHNAPKSKTTSTRSLTLRDAIQYGFERGNGNIYNLLMQLKEQGRDHRKYKAIKEYADYKKKTNVITEEERNFILASSKKIIKVLQQRDSTDNDYDVLQEIDRLKKKYIVYYEEANNDDANNANIFWSNIVDRKTWDQKKSKLFTNKENDEEIANKLQDLCHSVSVSVEPPLVS